MAEVDEKPHAPTARRVADMRRQGHTPSSRVLSAAVALFVAWIALGIGAEPMVAALTLLVRRACEGASHLAPLAPAFADAATTGFMAAGSPLLALAASGVFIGIVQARGRWWPARRERFLRACFDRGRFVGAVGAVVALAVLAGAACLLSARVLPSLLALHATSARRVLVAIGQLVHFLWLRLAVVALALGVADYLWQRHAHARSLRMSHEELKRDQRETEGDPIAKAARRRLHQEGLQDLDVGEIAECTLILAGPALAAAVRYDGKHAPRLVAKTRGRATHDMLSVARKAAVPILERPDVAAALATLRVGDEVPGRLYSALAEAFVDAGVPCSPNHAVPAAPSSSAT